MLTHYNNYILFVGYSPPGEYLNKKTTTRTKKETRTKKTENKARITRTIYPKEGHICSSLSCCSV